MFPRRYRYRRSQLEISSEERSYRRAASFLREFHRSQSLEVIVEESDHHKDEEVGESSHGQPAFPMLQKKGACVCLVDLAAAADETDDNSRLRPGEDEYDDCVAGDNSLSSSFEKDGSVSISGSPHAVCVLRDFCVGLLKNQQSRTMMRTVQQR